MIISHSCLLMQSQIGSVQVLEQRKLVGLKKLIRSVFNMKLRIQN